MQVKEAVTAMGWVSNHVEPLVAFAVFGSMAKCNSELFLQCFRESSEFAFTGKKLYDRLNPLGVMNGS